MSIEVVLPRTRVGAACKGTMIRDRRACHFWMLAGAMASTVFEQFKCLTTAVMRTTEGSSMALEVFATKYSLAQDLQYSEWLSLEKVQLAEDLIATVTWIDILRCCM